MAWMKAFPKEHDPFFLYIITAYLVSTSPTIPLTERTIPRNLAFRSLQKAAIDAYTQPERDVSNYQEYSVTYHTNWLIRIGKWLPWPCTCYRIRPQAFDPGLHRPR